MQYWLIKSEPDVWSIEKQKKAGKKGVAWDGVRNYQASNNLKKMKLGDLCFFYHSNIGKEIVGIVKVIRESFSDKTDKEKKRHSRQCLVWTSMYLMALAWNVHLHASAPSNHM